MENQFSVKVNIIRSDIGTEFVNNKVKNLFDTKGVVHQSSCAYTQQQNTVVKRRHMHILNVSRSLFFEYGLPFFSWDVKLYKNVFSRKMKNQSSTIFFYFWST